MNNNNIQEWILAIYGRNTTTDNTNIVLYKCFGSVAEAKNKLSKYINKEVETLEQKGYIVNGTLSYDEFHVIKDDCNNEIGYIAFINIYDKHGHFKIVYHLKKESEITNVEGIDIL